MPASRVKRFYTLHDKQRLITCRVFQGESRWVENNLLLETIDIQVPPRPAGQESMDVRFSYDVNGLLDVDVTITSTGKSVSRLVESRAGKLSDKEKKASRARLERLKVLPKDQEEVRTLLARADRMYASMLSNVRSHLGRIISDFETVLDRQDPREIKLACAELHRILDELDSDVWV